jgi:hypothetical protein
MKRCIGFIDHACAVQNKDVFHWLPHTIPLKAVKPKLCNWCVALAGVERTVKPPREGMAATRCLHPILYPWQVHPHVQKTISQSIVTLTGTGERWNVAHSSLGMLPFNRFE